MQGSEAQKKHAGRYCFVFLDQRVRGREGWAHVRGVVDVTEGKEGPKKKILIIDDEEDLCVLAGFALTANRTDLEVISAKDGPSGLERARAEQPAAIVLDINMPKMDGYEVCRRLKADAATRGIPVVMLTASGDPHLNQKAFDAGAVACLTKPYRQTALVNCVDMALASGERARARPH